MNTIAKWLTTLALTAGPMAANATLTFNYADDYAYDSSTGLYWQIEAVPTSTFVPSGGGQFATGAQVGQLINDVGASSFSGAAPYSVQIANLLSFFTADRPAPRDSGTIPAENYVLPWTAFVDSYGSPDTGHNFYTASYSGGPSSPSSSDWVYSDNYTLGEYGPGDPFPDCGTALWPACGSQTINAFLVSEIAPVPLPASAWLLLFGLSGLGGMLRRRTESEVSCLNFAP